MTNPFDEDRWTTIFSENAGRGKRRRTFYAGTIVKEKRDRGVEERVA